MGGDDDSVLDDKILSDGCFCLSFWNVSSVSGAIPELVNILAALERASNLILLRTELTS